MIVLPVLGRGSAQDAVPRLRRLAESWDNCGILVDAEDKDEIADGSIFLTNDLTLPVLEEALALNARLIVTYHPVRPIQSPALD